MCVRLALVVVLDLSSPRVGLGSRIAWGLPWGDFSFPCSGGIFLLRPVQRYLEEIIVFLDSRLMDVVGHLLVQRYMFRLDLQYKPVVSES